MIVQQAAFTQRVKYNIKGTTQKIMGNTLICSSTLV